MIISSSLHPNHANAQAQLKCIKSWQRFGQVVFMQHESEIETLETDFPDYDFIPAPLTVERLLGKKLVAINSFIIAAKTANEDLLLINSDILIADLPKLKQDGITCFQRNDYKLKYGDGKPFNNGWDAFYIPKEFLNIFPPSIYAMGACWWDYSMPYTAIKENVPLYLNSSACYHKEHKLQWNFNEWVFYGEYFRLMNNLKQFAKVQDMGTYILNKIKQSFA